MSFIAIDREAAFNGIEVTQEDIKGLSEAISTTGALIADKVGLPFPGLIGQALSWVGGALGLTDKPKKINQDILMGSLMEQTLQLYQGYTLRSGVGLEYYPTLLSPSVKGESLRQMYIEIASKLRQNYSMGTDDYSDIGLGISSVKVVPTMPIDMRAIIQFAEGSATPGTGSGSGSGTGSGTGTGTGTGAGLVALAGIAALFLNK